MPKFERISVVVSISLIGLALYFVLDFPTEATEFNLLGSPLALNSLPRWLMVFLLWAMTVAGMDNIVRSNPYLSGRRLDYLATFWMLPGLLVVAATQSLGLAPSPAIWGISLLVVGVCLWLTIAAEVQSINPDSQYRLWAKLWQQFIGYAVALIFFIVIYQTRSRSAISATAVTLVGGMVALALLRQPPHAILKTWIYAVVIGLSLGQITWALNYWRTGALNAGLLLFLMLYILLGLARQQLSGSLSRRTVWEFGAISLVALVVIFNL